MALQYFLRQFNLPDLRVVMDEARAKEDVIGRSERLGAIVFPVDLEERELCSEDVLKVTKNYPDGVDATSWDITTADRNTYYDWLAYEILNLAPRHIFVPVGTGELFSNLASSSTAMSANAPGTNAQRPIQQINIYGAATENPNSKMVMLYANAARYPAPAGNVSDFKAAGSLGEQSGVFAIDDNLAEKALFGIQRQAVGARCARHV